MNLTSGPFPLLKTSVHATHSAATEEPLFPIKAGLNSVRVVYRTLYFQLEICFATALIRFETWPLNFLINKNVNIYVDTR